MKTSKGFIFTVALIIPILVGSCESSLNPSLTEVHPVLAPGVYGAFEQPATRTVTYPMDIQNAGHNGFTYNPNPIPLPNGSTVWLMYRQAKDGITNPNPDNAAHWGPTDLKAYVVKADQKGYNALYPVPFSDRNGILYITDNLDAYTTQLYLNEGTYQFRAVSPAHPIRKSDYRMAVDNGMWLYAHDERYNQTKSSVVVIGGESDTQNVLLNPMVSQVARLEINMSPTANKSVCKMEIMDQGIEISGLQNPEMTDGGTLMFKWSSLSIADTLQMKKGDKGQSIVIHDFTTDEETGTITGSTAILPTDAMSTMVVVLINMAVNGIPTQYILTLSQMKFFHGHSYKLDLKLDLEGNVYVMNWANQSWNGTVTLN